MEEARAGGVGRGLDAVRQEAGQRRQAAVSVLRQLANEMPGGFVAFRTSASWELIDPGKITAGGVGPLGLDGGERGAILGRVGDTPTFTAAGANEIETE